MMNRAVAVYGAYGHTGRFVVAELLRRGLTPILSGRDAGRLNVLATAYPGIAVRAARVDDAAALDAVLEGAAAVINCAGPFATTASPVIQAALRKGIPYVDVAAEIEANLDTFERHDADARACGVTIVPAMAFYGGLGDLLATAAMGDWMSADEVCVAYGLSGWVPTAGTMIAGQVSRERRGGLRIAHVDGRLQLSADAPPVSAWTFPAPIGRQDVAEEFTMADTVTIARHLDVSRIRSFMTTAAVSGLRSGPQADADGRPPERFVVEVVARRDGVERRACASGQDIYATTAPLVVEAVIRLLGSTDREPGVRTAGQAFDARDFLSALSPEPLAIRLG
ncbi:saccharopine dehydrogenase NADP-binding domain-containing protein [Longimicrobium sp.]|uniref:saccharopine dehydrogenase NADP-binding domain-containing protein n=1 Tax=Longimicrobium sp. TaxID=2029185 RepID=UPI002E32FC6B|nr:saccharopine dehydrogenase NADP-binding domain-containing protein [Longimicrobium sp.]HEX6037189.1 saccharopine dehydrogenase NADP-binding domain-containing protein [Longimicrobium sp.]